MNPEEALQFIVEELNTTVEKIQRRDRHTHMIYNRHLSCYVLKRAFTEITWSEVGDLVDRDRTTVMNSFQKVEDDSIRGIRDFADEITQRVKQFDLTYDFTPKVKFIYPGSKILNGLYKMQIV